MKQRLGEKKHKLCEAIAGRVYESCWTRGGWSHGFAQCVWPPQEGEPTEGCRPMTCDMVDMRARTVTPDLYKGQRVK